MNIDKPPDIKKFMKTIKVMALVHPNVCFPLLIFAITLVKIKTTISIELHLVHTGRSH